MCQHIASPSSNNLFSAAIMESGDCDGPWLITDGADAKVGALRGLAAVAVRRGLFCGVVVQRCCVVRVPCACGVSAACATLHLRRGSVCQLFFRRVRLTRRAAG